MFARLILADNQIHQSFFKLAIRAFIVVRLSGLSKF